jgi:signal peptide peptidase SppA
MKPYSHILRAAHSMIWAIQPEKLEAIMAFLEMKAAGGSADDSILAGIQARNVEAAARAAAMSSAGSGSVAVLPLFGIISHRASMMGDMSGPGGTSTERFTQQFRGALNDPNVKAIVIDIDSPGGTVDGVAELADEIFKARSKKSITAISDCTMASAAYWIGVSATELVCSPSAMVGSIGVYTSHEDLSKALETDGIGVSLISAGKYKTEGSPYAPLTEDARAAMQSMVDDYYGMFTKAVARGRGVNVSDVTGGFGQGRMVSAQQAVSLGMADRVATLDQVLSKLGVSRGNGTSAMSAGPLAVAPKADDSCTCPCDPCQEDGNCAGCDCPDCEQGNAEARHNCANCNCPAMSGFASARATESLRIEATRAAVRDRLRLASL